MTSLRSWYSALSDDVAPWSLIGRSDQAKLKAISAFRSAEQLNKETVQENPSLEEEEEIIQELEQTLVNQEEVVVKELVQALVTQENEIFVETIQTTNEKEVVISPIVRTEEVQEKEVEGNLYDRFQRVEREMEKEERNKTENELEKGEPEKSLQIHTDANPIQNRASESQDDSSNEGTSTDGTKLLKSMTSLLTSLQTNVIAMGSHFFSRQSEMMSLERQINLDNHCEVMESMELYKNQLVEIQGSLGRTYGESTRSKRAPTNDKNPRPTKRGGGRSGGDRRGRSSSGGRGGKSGSDRGRRTSGGDHGGRSSGRGRGGRALPPFQNLLTSEGMCYEGTRFPNDPRVKR
ncbi:keratin, type I cytoskeletal 10-like [Impatiens glandulifera]|uniref:keratin, type I cytoskeletal 10-like n=1 Tax=Impatiens glandulifera TaxID=253017 RepID=UPI001FB19B9F|nr:keratin, type I cytoskeletal 10-like [Impatiens glandulifera]